MGRTTSDPTVRVKSVGEHQLFYAPTDPEIHVLSIWHGRRDPTARPF
ncbi:MAG: hypothetical protein IPL86_15290 [Flavobacteriales bacterium]|nr:hypothetical protein [Flavobacteriales bacterium]